MAERKSEVIITVNHNQAQKALDVMQEKLKRLQNSLNAMQDKTSEKAKQVQKEIKDIKAVIGELSGNIEKVDKVLNNLSGSSLRQLNAALRQVKKEMSRVSSDSPKLDELRQKYKAITDQIKILQGETLNIKKHIGELSQVSDNWLSKAINQQKTLVGSLSKTDQAYQSQLNTLHRLQEEQARRAVSTINDGGASADDLRAARANLVAYRDQLGVGGIMPENGKVAEEIEKINIKLKQCDEQLDIINGKERQIELTTDQLQEKAEKIILDPKKFTPKEIKAAIDDIQNKLKKLSLNDPAREKLGQSMKQLQNILNGVDKELIDIGELLKPQNLKKASLEQLQQAAKQLEEEMRKADRSLDDFTSKQKQLATIRGEIEKTTSAVHKQSSAWKTTFRNISMYFGVFQLFSFAQQKLQEMLRANLEYSDQMGDIRKVTGLAADEVDRLAESIAKIDTRTSIQELSDLAYQGGKMGFGQYGVEGMTEFVRAADQVKVALSDDLGDDSLLQISKLVDTMGLIPKMGVEKSMLSVGSAINQLSATSTASGTHIVDFAKRLTGLARITGITTPELLALGSAADALGQAPEVAATAFGKLFTSLQTKHNLIEQQLNMEKGTISNLFEQGKAMEAILLIMEKMRDKGNMNALGNIWKDLGSEGQRLIGVMATMSKNVDTVRAHVDESNVAFSEAVSLSNEYALKQETANAILERANNLWEKAFVNPEGVDMVKELAQSWYDASKSMTESETYMQSIKITMGLLAGAVELLIRVLPLLIRMMMFYGVVAAIKKVRMEYIAMSGAIEQASTAQAKLNAFMKANLFALIISLALTAVSAMVDYAIATNRAAKAKTDLQQAEEDAMKNSAKERAELKRLYDATQDTTLAMSQRIAKCDELRKAYPGYFDDLTNEQILAGKAADAYKRLTQEIINAARARAIEKKIEQLQEENINLEDENERLNKWNEEHEGEYIVEKGKIDQAVGQQNRMEVAGLPGTKMGYVHARNKGNAQLVGQYQGNVRQMTANEEKRKANDERIAKLAQQSAGLSPESPGSLDNDARDPEAEKRRKAEEAARRKALRAQMKEEQEKAKAIIDNVKNYYERQIAAITEMATRTGMSEEWQKKMTDGMTQRMNSALSEVRKAIAGTENEWAAFRQTMIDDLYEPLGDDGKNQSTDLLDNIIHNDIEKLKQMITVLSKELGQNGSVLLDQIWRKATENQLANARKENKAYQARQQLLLEKNYTGKVNRDYENQMEQLGVSDLTAEQTAQLMGWSQEGNQEAIQQFVNERSQQWQSALYNAREHIVEVLAADSPESLFDVIFPDWQDNIGQNNVLGDLFDVKDVLDENGQIIGQRLKLEDDRFKAFFQKLIEYSDAYTDAQKKAYDEAKRRADFVFNNRPDIQQLDTQTGQLSDINRDQQRFESDKNFSQQMGMSWNMDQDPEILRYRMLAERAKLYFAEMKRLRAEDKISAEQLNEAQRQMMDAQAEMADRIASKFHERVQLLQQFSEPIATFAEGVGEYLGNLVSDTEDSSIKLKDLAKNMLKAYAKMTIQLMAEDLTRRVTKQLYHRQEEADETMHQMTLLTIQQSFAAMMLAAQATSDTARLTQHSATNATELSEEAATTSAKVPLGIAGGAAKIIGTLGFWGIPLIAVISALLMGLLSWAISAAFGGSDKSGSDSGQNVKLATGMLTYDSGNAQSFSHPSRPGSPASSGSPAGDKTPVLGNDGKVYNARQVPQLETGIVRSPIATLVNGQPSLVAEKGPEMVIGRETTHAMQMNRPDLINEIVKFDKNHSAGAGYRMYDEGNLDELGLDGMTGDAANGGMGLTSEDIKSFRDSISDFTAMMLLLQKNGLHVNKYGRGGVAQESQDGANFMRRNSGDRLWKK